MPGNATSPLAKRGHRGVGRLGYSLIACCFALTASPAFALVTISDPGTFVVDRANIIDAATEQKLEGWLRELEQKTTAQVKILTVPTLDGEPAFNFAQRHAELWRLGKKGKDNGTLIVIAPKDREYRIHVGYGLEPVLPDSWVGTLGRTVIVPAFKQGDFSGGVYNAAVHIANKIAEDANVTLTGMPQMRLPGVKPSGGLLAGLLPLLVLGLIIWSMTRRRRYSRGWGGLGRGIFWGSMLGGRGGWGGGSSSGWGGGFGGGSGGGFGGSFGGGGGFGGGGAGGKW